MNGRPQLDWLAGVGAVELGDGLAGSYCGRLLTALGARVTKVGDRAESDPALAARRLYLDAGKAQATPGADVEALCRSAAIVVVDCFAAPEPGGWPNYAALAADNPAVVVARITPFGERGPYAGYRGGELATSAVGGIMANCGDPAREPLVPGGAQVQYSAGLAALDGVLAALTVAERTGVGQDVEVAAFESAALLEWFGALNVAYNGYVKERGSGVGRWPVLRCADGGFVSPIYSPEEWPGFAAAMEDDRLRDPRFATQEGRNEHIDELTAIWQGWAIERTADEAYRALQAQGVIAGASYDIPALLANEHYAARHFWETLALPGGRELRSPGLPFLVDGTRPTVADEPPAQVPTEGRDDPPYTGSSAPLAGVRIIDFTGWAAGAGTTAILADLGAEVIKVEAHTRFDASRGWGPWPDGFDGKEPWNHCGSFHQLNRNKLGVTLDLKSQRGRDLLERLVASADLVVENFRAGVLERMGFGHARLEELRPGIILLSLTAFGGPGPDGAFGAMGPTIEMVAGLAALTRYPDDDLPYLTGVHYTDTTTPLLASALAIAAVRRQRRTGEGGRIEVSQRELQTGHLGELILAQQLGVEPPVSGNTSARHAPFGVYRCGEGWLTVEVTDDAMWRALCAVIDREDLAARYPDAAARTAGRETIDAALAHWLADVSPGVAMRVLQRAGVAAGAVWDSEALYHDEGLRARGFFRAVPGLPGVGYKRAPFVLEAMPWATPAPAPRLGEHTAEVLAQLAAVEPAEYERLVVEGVIGTEPPPSVWVSWY